MRIDTLRVQNFRGSAEREFAFHPQFNVLIGDNGTGKTATLEALRIAISAWFLEMDGSSPRGFHDEDIRLEGHGFKGDFTFEPKYPVKISARGVVDGTEVGWTRAKQRTGGNTDHKWSNPLKQIARRAEQAVRNGEAVSLPVLAYYGTERLYGTIREQSPKTKDERQFNKVLKQIGSLSEDDRASFLAQLRVSTERAGATKADLSRFAGYRGSMDPRINQREFSRWVERQAWISFQRQETTAVYARVRDLLTEMLDGIREIDYSAVRYEVVVVEEDGGVKPFGQLSDGYRNVIAMVGDLAMRVARLNPHLGDEAFAETRGVVLIDELDMHLHPNWQRQIGRQLRSAFPNVQFIVATHSPLIIGETEPESVFDLSAPETLVPRARQSVGLDANAVLRGPMHTGGVRSSKAEALVRKAEAALEEGEVETAEATLAEMRAFFHGDTTDTVGVEATIHNLIALADDDDLEDGE